MSKRSSKRRKADNQYSYDVLVTDWHVDVSFNDFAYINLFDSEEFEERIIMVLEGHVTSTLSKKCKKDMTSKVFIHPSEIWYDKHLLREDLHTIGNMEIRKTDLCVEKEDVIYFRVSVPTKSYESIMGYLAHKGKAMVRLVGTELYRRKGDIYYLGFEKEF